MKGLQIVTSLLLLAIVSSVKSNAAYHKYLNDISPEIQTKCFEEADLVADKEKVLTDEMSVDPQKLSCFVACVYKETGVMTDGNMSFDALEKQLDVSWAGDPTIDARKEIIKECIAGATGGTDCEKVSSMSVCTLKKIAETGI